MKPVAHVNKAPAANPKVPPPTKPMLNKAYQRFGGYPVFIGNLSLDVTETNLYEIFSRIGPIASIRLCRNAFTRMSLGYAYMNFLSKSDAERAIKTMNFLKINGKECRLMWSLYGRNRDWRVSGNGNLFIRGLHDSIDNKKLYEHFLVYGEINSVRVAYEKRSHKHKGFGYVQFANKQDAEVAMQATNGLILHGMKLEVKEFVPLMERIRRSKWTNVYVKYIPQHISEKELVAVFENACAGMITSSKLWDRAYGRSACLNFATHEQAIKAVRRMAGYRFSRDIREQQRKAKQARLARKLQEKAHRNRERERRKAAATCVVPLSVALGQAPGGFLPPKRGGALLEEDEKKGRDDGDAKSDAGSTVSSSSASSASNTPRPEPLGLYVTRAQKKWERVLRLRDRIKNRPKLRQLSMPYRFDVRRLGPHMSPQHLQKMLMPFGNLVAARVAQGPNGPSGVVVGVVPNKWGKGPQMSAQQLQQQQQPQSKGPYRVFVPPPPPGLFKAQAPVGPNDLTRKTLKVPMSQFVLPAATPPRTPPFVNQRMSMQSYPSQQPMKVKTAAPMPAPMQAPMHISGMPIAMSGGMAMRPAIVSAQ